MSAASTVNRWLRSKLARSLAQIVPGVVLLPPPPANPRKPRKQSTRAHQACQPTRLSANRRKMMAEMAERSRRRLAAASMRGTLDQLLAQYVLLHLAHGVAWQIGDKVYAFGHLEICQQGF